MMHLMTKPHAAVAVALSCALVTCGPPAIGATGELATGSPPGKEPDQHQLGRLEPTVQTSAGTHQAFDLPDNLPAVEEIYPLSGEAKAALQSHGFVVLPDAQEPRLSSAYFSLFGESQVSVFITTDAALHLFHNVFDGIVAEIERESLLTCVTAMADKLYESSETEAGAIPEENTLGREAARHNMIVFAVAARLLDEGFRIPEDLEPEASEYVSKVLEHTDTEFYPGDDYTIYEPRGHYAGDDDLERYFRAVKWLGRRIYRIEDRRYPHDADVELTAAAMLARMVTQDPEISERWARVYDVTSLFAGAADSITPLLMADALAAAFGDGFDLAMLEDEQNRDLLRAELAKDAYPTSEIIPVPLAFPDQIPPKYVQVMGERYLPDAHVMHETTFPNVPERLLPSGLDVMATVLGSERAEYWLAPELARHPDLAGRIGEQRLKYEQYSGGWWRRSVYNNWLYSLRPVLQPAPASAPAFTQSAVWRDKQLNTAMGSWTQLRHDMILYGKQTMVPSPWAEGPGLVEPVPEAFSRLADLCDSLHSELQSRGALPATYARALTELRQHLFEWALYARKTADGEALSDEEQAYVHRTGMWLLELFAQPGGIAEKSPMLVADVATDSNSGRVLHEGTGHFRPLIVVYTPPGGEPIAGIGFAFCQYEFVETDWNRLSDEEWETRLSSDPPEQPPWVMSFLPVVPHADRHHVYLPTVRLEPAR